MFWFKWNCWSTDHMQGARSTIITGVTGFHNDAIWNQIERSRVGEEVLTYHQMCLRLITNHDLGHSVRERRNDLINVSIAVMSYYERKKKVNTSSCNFLRV